MPTLDERSTLGGMLGRRFLLLVAVLMGLTALAATIAPREPLSVTAHAARATPTPTPSRRATAATPVHSVSRTSDDHRRPGPDHGRAGHPLELTVKGDELGSVDAAGSGRADRARVAGDLQRARRHARRVPDRHGRRGPRRRHARRQEARARRFGRGAPPGRRARAGTRPLPSHHGHVTVCGVPPRPEITLPVPRQAVQRCGSWDLGRALRSRPGQVSPDPEGATDVEAARVVAGDDERRVGGAVGRERRDAASAAPRGRSAAAAARTGGTRSRPCSDR